MFSQPRTSPLNRMELALARGDVLMTFEASRLTVLADETAPSFLEGALDDA